MGKEIGGKSIPMAQSNETENGVSGTSQEKDTSPELTKVSSDDIYETMCLSLYAYRFGAIGFLDLLEKFEETLGIRSPQTSCQKDLAAKG